MQRGKDEAWTEVTLSGGGGGQRDMVVRRDIRQVRKDDGTTGYASKWRLNGGRGRAHGGGAAHRPHAPHGGHAAAAEPNSAAHGPPPST